MSSDVVEYCYHEEIIRNNEAVPLDLSVVWSKDLGQLPRIHKKQIAMPGTTLMKPQDMHFAPCPIIGPSNCYPFRLNKLRKLAIQRINAVNTTGMTNERVIAMELFRNPDAYIVWTDHLDALVAAISGTRVQVVMVTKKDALKRYLESLGSNPTRVDQAKAICAVERYHVGDFDGQYLPVAGVTGAINLLKTWGYQWITDEHFRTPESVIRELASANYRSRDDINTAPTISASYEHLIKNPGPFSGYF